MASGCNASGSSPSPDARMMRTPHKESHTHGQDRRAGRHRHPLPDFAVADRFGCDEPRPDYSAVYVTLRSDDPSAPAGHALVFTIGRGNEVQVAAVRALTELVVGRDVDALLNGLGAFARSLAGDSQLRWLGPEKGVMQMAIGGVVNAAWDMAARRAGLPLWRFIAELPPERIVDAIDFRYLADALTPGEALAILRRMEPRREARIAELSERGYP